MADAGYPTLGDIRAAMPPEELRAHRRNLAALILLPFVIAAIHTLYCLLTLPLQPFMIGGGMQPALRFAAIVFVVYFMFLPACLAASCLVVAVMDRNARGHDLVRLGPSPYVRTTGNASQSNTILSILLGVANLSAALESRITENGFFIQGFFYPMEEDPLVPVDPGRLRFAVRHPALAEVVPHPVRLRTPGTPGERREDPGCGVARQSV